MTTFFRKIEGNQPVNLEYDFYVNSDEQPSRTGTPVTDNPNDNYGNLDGYFKGSETLPGFTPTNYTTTTSLNSPTMTYGNTVSISATVNSTPMPPAGRVRITIQAPDGTSTAESISINTSGVATLQYYVGQYDAIQNYSITAEFQGWSTSSTTWSSSTATPANLPCVERNVSIDYLDDLDGVELHDDASYTARFRISPKMLGSISAVTDSGTASVTVANDGATDQIATVTWYPTAFGAGRTLSILETNGHNFLSNETVTKDVLTEISATTRFAAVNSWTWQNGVLRTDQYSDRMYHGANLSGDVSRSCWAIDKTQPRPGNPAFPPEITPIEIDSLTFFTTALWLRYSTASIKFVVRGAGSVSDPTYLWSVRPPVDKADFGINYTGVGQETTSVNDGRLDNYFQNNGQTIFIWSHVLGGTGIPDYQLLNNMTYQGYDGTGTDEPYVRVQYRYWGLS